LDLSGGISPGKFPTICTENHTIDGSGEILKKYTEREMLFDIGRYLC